MTTTRFHWDPGEPCRVQTPTTMRDFKNLEEAIRFHNNFLSSEESKQTKYIHITGEFAGQEG